jgi:hypothetical protein
LRDPDALEWTLVAGAAAAWLLKLTPNSGGFHDSSTAVTALAFLPALLVVRPWRWVSAWLLLVVALAATGSVLVLERSATGWQQADSPSGQILGLVALVITGAFARTAGRRRAVLVVLLTGVAIEFLPAWKAWHGSGDPNHLLVGTFYWHNQLGIWMVGLGLVAMAHAVGGKGRARFVSGTLAALASAATALSTSRTCLALLVAGAVCLLPLILRSHDKLRALASWLAVAIGGVAILLVLTGSLFFSKPWSGLSAVQATANNPGALGNRGTSSLATNGGDRGRWTSAALSTWRQHPTLGDGFGSFRFTVGSHLKPDQNVSSFVHDGYAEALTSGGLAFGLPLLGAWLVVGWAAVRRWLGSLRQAGAERPVYLGFAVAAGALLLHAAVDFDWHYPSLVVLLGVIGGVLLPARQPVAASAVRISVTVVGSVLVLGLVVTMSLAEHHGRQVTTDGRARTATQLLEARWWGMYDPRIDAAALAACLGPDGRLVVPPSVARRALQISARAATLDPQIRDLRARVSSAVS